MEVYIVCPECGKESHTSEAVWYGWCNYCNEWSDGEVKRRMTPEETAEFKRLTSTSQFYMTINKDEYKKGGD